MPRSYRSVVVVALCLMLGYGVCTVRAQEPPTQPERQPLYTLGQAFPLVAWNSETHGVLLAIAPEQVSDPSLPALMASYISANDAEAKTGDNASAALFPPSGHAGLNVSLVARHFDQTLIHLSTMTVFAPSRMVTLNQDLKPANPYLDMSAIDRMRLLLAMLTDDQWRTLTDPAGLGFGNLSREQQPIFEALVPEDFVIEQWKPATSGEEYTVGASPASDLTMDQRRGLRIRLDRYPQMDLAMPWGDHSMVLPFTEAAKSAVTTQLVEKPFSSSPNSQCFGQQVRLQNASHLKPTDLDLTASNLNVWVPISDARTVGDLIRAVRQATGLELYADGRFSRRPIAVNGGDDPKVRASELLESLCWGMSATFRRLGPTSADAKSAVYLLTYDRVGLGVQRGRIKQWASQGERAKDKVNAKFIDKIKNQTPEKCASYVKGNLLNPGPEAEKLLEAAIATIPGVNAVELPLSALTKDQRDQLDDWIATTEQKRKDHPEDTLPPFDLSSYHLTLSTDLDITFILPGIGEIRPGHYSWGAMTNDNGANTSSLPYDLSEAERAKPMAGGNVILTVSVPEDQKAAEALVAVAARRGIRQIWIRLPDTASPPPIFAACVALGKQHHLPVGAVMGLMHAPSAGVSPAWESINVFGETGQSWASQDAQLADGGNPDLRVMDDKGADEDILDPDVAAVRAYLKRRVERVASIPGIAGLALVDVAAPGYGGSGHENDGKNDGTAFGYTSENRIAFLRKSGYDPIDLDTLESMNSEGVAAAMELPIIDDQYGGDSSKPGATKSIGDVTNDWEAFLCEQQTATLRFIRTDLLALLPALPVYLYPRIVTRVDFETPYYKLWEPQDADVVSGVSNDDLRTKPALWKSVYPLVPYTRGTFAELQKSNPETAKGITETRLVAAYLRDTLVPDSSQPNGPHPAAVVLDLTTFSIPEAVDLIRGIFLPAGDSAGSASSLEIPSP